MVEPSATHQAAPRGEHGLIAPSARGRSLRRIGDVIVDLGFATREEVEAAVNEARNTGRNTGRVLMDRGTVGPEELARAIVRLAGTRTRIGGASDHGGSEAIYLRDPDDNGRPRSCSPWRRRRQRACSERPTRARAPRESTAWSGVADRSGIGMERAGGRGRNRVSPTYPMPMLRLPCARVSKEL